MGRPTIYPTGTTIYDPEKAWNGYTLFPIDDIGAILIDMNGRVVKVWKDFQTSCCRAAMCWGRWAHATARFPIRIRRM